ncbi:MAG: hypothetical protein H0U77_12525 [Nocardioidaceae bacterium]|nr:hypothetical protein [Nocardioidaceae bacterium]
MTETKGITTADAPTALAGSFRRVVREHRGACVVVAGFALSRIALAAVAGLEFDVRPLNDGLQVLDRGELRENLLSSLAHMHAQPPLYNLFVGIGLHAPLWLETPLFHAAYLAIGLALALCLYAILRRVGVGTTVAVVVTLGFTWSPSVFLYESWMHYDYPLVLLLVLAVLALLRYERSGAAVDAGVFLSIVAAVVLTRSLFHLGWLLVWAVVVFVRRDGPGWRRLTAAVAVPVLVVVGLHAQRLVAFGAPSLSSALGISLAKVTTFQLPEIERRQLVADGRLSALALVEPLSPAAAYHGLVPMPEQTGIPVLDEEQKGIYTRPDTENEFFRTNTNASIFLEISERNLEDALYTIRERPDAYVQGLKTASEIFFRPTSDFFTLERNRQKVYWLDRFYNHVVFGVVDRGNPPGGLPQASVRYTQGPARTAWFVLGAYGFVFAAGALTLLNGARRRRDRTGPPLLVVGFLWLSTVYVVVVSNAFEVGENNRFRLYSDPLVLALLALLVVRWRDNRRGRGGDAAGEAAPNESAAEPGARSEVAAVPVEGRDGASR